MIGEFEKTMLAYQEGRIKSVYPRDENVTLVLNLYPVEYRITEITIPEDKGVTALVVIDS